MNWRHDARANFVKPTATGYLAGWFRSPGFQLVAIHRYSASRYRKGRIGRLLSVLAWRRIVARFGCYMSPLAKIGPGLYLPHPTGIVIGDASVIGADVTIYQHVTIGRASAARDGYPRIEDGAVIYAGAVVIGDLTIGKGAVIAANAVVTHDVPAGAVAGGIPARVLRQPEPAPTTAA